jgi:two-component system alkaline phosphatase synthesis response regulator PhoP
MLTDILIVEDEPNLGSTLQEYLSLKNFNCHLATNLADARNVFQSSQSKIKIVLMDIGLPDGSGLDLAKELFSINNKLILIFLSAQNDPSTRLMGLDLGAYDYITKPFELRELTLRLERILQQQSSPDEKITFEEIHFDPSSLQISYQDHGAVQLNVKESGIFHLLISHVNQVISRDQMIDSVWGANEFPSNRTIDNYIVRLRKIIDELQIQHIEIVSIRGVGYKMQLKKEAK